MKHMLTRGLEKTTNLVHFSDAISSCYSGRVGLLKLNIISIEWRHSMSGTGNADDSTILPRLPHNRKQVKNQQEVCQIIHLLNTGIRIPVKKNSNT